MNQRIKSDNKKAMKKFFIVLILATIVGGIIGGLPSRIGSVKVGEIESTLVAFLDAIRFYAIPVVVLLTILPGCIIYARCKNMLQGDDISDEVHDKVDYLLNYPILLSNINNIGALFFFSVNVTMQPKSNESMIVLVFFLLSAALSFVMLQRTVDFVRELNPEKRGSAYDFNFTKKWEDSSDEAQKLMAYKAAYKAFKVTSITCIVLWVILQILAMTFNIGLLPIAVVLFLYLVMIITYTVESIRLERK